MEPSLERDWRDPFLLPAMREVAQRICKAIHNKELICVFGDYDLDGMSATALAVRGLRDMGARVEPILPQRLEDGYGLTAAAVERITVLKPDVVLTVDTGISAAPEVDILRDRGFDVVITDHHEPGDLIPQGVPVCNPKLDPDYAPQGDHLAGAGVSLKLIQAVGECCDSPNVWRGLVDIATLGTVADVMPLIGENRALVAAGVEKMRLNPCVGIAALAAEARLDCAHLVAENISFSLAPRLNAAGRMASPMDSLNLLLEDDPEQAAELARILTEHNRARQLTEAEMTEEVMAILERDYHGESAIVLAGADWHDGVKGIVASRVAHRFHVPTVLCSVEDGVAIGSGRSVGRIDLYKAFEACSETLDRFGGHAGAAGMAVALDKLDDFRRALCAELDTVPPELAADCKQLDAYAYIDELSVEVAHEIERLEPFGEGNPRPLLMSRAISLNNPCTVGRDGVHLKFQAYSNHVQVPAIQFRCPRIEHVLAHPDFADIVYRLELDCWQGRERIQLMVTDIALLEEPAPLDEKSDDIFLQELYAKADESLKRREYAGIGDAASFFTKVAGVTKGEDNRQELISHMAIDENLEIRRDPQNDYDPNAIAVYVPRFDKDIGFLNKDLAAVLAPLMDAGRAYSVRLGSITGGIDGKHYGVNIEITNEDSPKLHEERARYRAHQREQLSQCNDPAALRAHLLKAFIGEGHLHSAQEKSLALLESGKNVLTVMATGRGKSLIFQLFAAQSALIDHKASVFVYPLRALVADQAYHLDEVFAELGLSVAVITGETPEGKRAEAFERLAAGDLDIVLTTPEFLHFHAREFARGSRIGFVTIDEAHHIGQARSGNRPAYAHLGEAIAQLNEDGSRPRVLAVTATADDATASRIRSVLSIDELVLDPTVRTNLKLSDARDCTHKLTYMIDTVKSGGKTVIYVNSRDASVQLARALRRAVPELGWKTAFYHGGLDRASRHEIERRFRTGEVMACVATSAFGEGVNIGDIRNVILYHLPFSEVEFNQMAGRSGRDGQPATIHVLSGKKDARINEYILSNLAPEHDTMAALYSSLLEAQERLGAGFKTTNNEIAEDASRRLGHKSKQIDESAVSSAVGVFRELGFVTTEGFSSARRITVNTEAAHRPLDSSTRYQEGQDECEEFSTFKEWLFNADGDTLLKRFNTPILPGKEEPHV